VPKKYFLLFIDQTVELYCGRVMTNVS